MNLNSNTTTVDATHLIGCVGKPFADGGLLVMEIEIWKDIPNYEGYYQVSSLGRVKSLKREVIKGRGNGIHIVEEKILAQHLSKDRGYSCVQLQKNKDIKFKGVHQLVGLAFIPNPLKKRTVNHIDGDKTNNRLDNLEWHTYREQILHRINVLGIHQPMGAECKFSKPLYQYDADFNLVKTWGSLADAERSGYSKSNIYYSWKGKKMRLGYYWSRTPITKETAND